MVNRKEAPDKITLSGRLAKEIRNVIIKHQGYFDTFDKIKVERWLVQASFHQGCW
ncbi:MAG: hypothetical protein Q4D29_06450 [Lachnospiraceae bacterium]|nr:hypothetical protein [Lachnospiraceae bacterium]